jgi:hypothetical protein
MTYFRVETQELTASDLAAALAAVNGAGGAAAGTPAAGAYEALLGDADKVVASLRTATDDLSGALGRAAAAYAGTEQGVTACYLPAGES